MSDTEIEHLVKSQENQIVRESLGCRDGAAGADEWGGIEGMKKKLNGMQ